MTQANLIPSLQSDALAREIEQQLKDETGAVIATAERDARALIAQARAAARTRMHEAIQELRREGGRRLSGAKAQFETNERARAAAGGASSESSRFRCCARCWMRAGAMSGTGGIGRTASRASA